MLSFAVRIRKDLPDPPLLSDIEVAALVGVSRSSVCRRARTSGKGTPVRAFPRLRSGSSTSRRSEASWARQEVTSAKRRPTTGLLLDLPHQPWPTRSRSDSWTRSSAATP
jgi:hypothetical protein